MLHATCAVYLHNTKNARASLGSSGCHVGGGKELTLTLQLRIYDIKQGEMEGWLRLFRERIVPLHEKFDMPVRAAWVAPERSQFVWMRELVGSGTAEEQEQRYRNSEE